MFCKRFSRPERTPMSNRQGADARRDATSGHYVRFSSPVAQALDQETSTEPQCGPLSSYPFSSTRP